MSDTYMPHYGIRRKNVGWIQLSNGGFFWTTSRLVAEAKLLTAGMINDITEWEVVEFTPEICAETAAWMKARQAEFETVRAARKA